MAYARARWSTRNGAQAIRRPSSLPVLFGLLVLVALNGWVLLFWGLDYAARLYARLAALLEAAC